MSSNRFQSNGTGEGSNVGSNWDIETSMVIWKVMCPTLVVMGTLGNVLTIVVLSSRHMTRFPTAPYLVAIAIADMLVLYSGSLNMMIYLYWYVDYATTSDVLCKIRRFSIYAFRHISVWLIIALTFERLVCVVSPIKSREIRFKHRIIIVVSVTIFFILFNCHLLFGSALIPTESTNQNGQISWICQYNSDVYHEFVNNILSYLDMVIFSLIPFCLLVIGNTAIVLSFKSARKRLGELSESDKSSTEAENRLTRLAFLLSATFLITSLPITLFMIYDDVYGISHTPGYQIISACLYNFGFLNNTLNFILYCFSGPTFRQALKSMFLCSK